MAKRSIRSHRKKTSHRRPTRRRPTRRRPTRRRPTRRRTAKGFRSFIMEKLFNQYSPDGLSPEVSRREDRRRTDRMEARRRNIYAKERYLQGEEGLQRRLRWERPKW